MQFLKISRSLLRGGSLIHKGGIAMKTEKESKSKTSKSSTTKEAKTVRKTEQIVVKIPDLGLSRSDLSILKKAFHNALVSSLERVEGVLKPSQKQKTKVKVLTFHLQPSSVKKKE
jgi:hypothetical protein